MAEWLSIIGIGEDGAQGLSGASLDVLAGAEVVFGGPRHLAMVTHPDRRPWPVPFSVAPVLALRGRRVAVLASGDPFWHGVGTTLMPHLAPGEWRAWPAVSAVSLAAARMGWALDRVAVLGLHAAPVARLWRVFAPGARVLATVRDGAAVAAVAEWLVQAGGADSRITALENLGGASERVRAFGTDAVPRDIGPLVVVAIEVSGAGLSCVPGLPDDAFEHDGQITKRPVRALALSALAPRRGEMLWDIGLGSGSVAIEWLLADPANRAVGVERDPARAARARRNADRFGVALEVHEGAALARLEGLPVPDAVFVGGGADDAVLDRLWHCLPPGVRVVVHAVTLETEALLTRWQAARGGTLLRVALSEVRPIGRKRGWQAAFPVVQWSVTR